MVDPCFSSVTQQRCDGDEKGAGDKLRSSAGFAFGTRSMGLLKRRAGISTSASPAKEDCAADGDMGKIVSGRRGRSFDTLDRDGLRILVHQATGASVELQTLD